jgi:hypothetical protein
VQSVINAIKAGKVEVMSTPLKITELMRDVWRHVVK